MIAERPGFCTSESCAGTWSTRHLGLMTEVTDVSSLPAMVSAARFGKSSRSVSESRRSESSTAQLKGWLSSTTSKAEPGELER